MAAVAFVLTLLFAVAAGAQETADDTGAQVEAKTSNVTVRQENGSVSVQTSNVSSSNQATDQQSSLTVRQNQVHEGSGSKAAAGDVKAAQTSGIPEGTPATGSNPDSPSSPPDLITIEVSDCTVDQGAEITVEDGDGTEARFVDGQLDIEIKADATQVTIEGPNDDFIGDHAVSTSDPGFDTDGDYQVVTTSGITCEDTDGGGNGGGGGGGGGAPRDPLDPVTAAETDATAIDDLVGAERGSGSFRCELFLRIDEDGRQAGRFQYLDDDLLVQRIEECREREVLAGTIPDRKLPDTGGSPLLLAPWLLALVAAGVTLLRRP